MPEDVTTGVDLTVQPTLPTLELPEYRGRKPVGMKTSINGAGNRVSRPHGIDDRVVLVLEAEVKKAGHEKTDDGLVYSEILKVRDLFEIAGDAGLRLLSTVRQSYRVADDEREGRQPIPGVDGWTDESGTVVSPDELAALRDDPARALADERVTPVVVLFSDGARQLWPEEFEEGEARPAVGDRYADERFGGGPASYVYVAKLLHADTGETLEEWTDAQEEARLLRMEDQAANEERVADGLADEIPSTRGEEPGSGEVVGSSPPDPPAELARAGDAPDDEIVLAEDEDGFADVVAFTGPSADDYKFIDRNAPDIKVDLPTVTDRDQLMRLIKAEENGRGRGLKPRKGVLEMIGRRAAELFSAHPAVPAPEVPVEPDGFEPGEDTAEFGDLSEG